MWKHILSISIQFSIIKFYKGHHNIKAIAASLILFFISVHLDSCRGLECKIGSAFILNNRPDSENSIIGTCPADSNYCLAIRCTKVDALRAYSQIFWKCAANQNVVGCMESANKLIEDGLNLTNIQCDCDYGEKGKDLTNVRYEVITAERRFNAKKGHFDSEGYGGTLVGECKDEDHFCFMASCAKDMNAIAASLILFLSSVFLDSCSGLECKIGRNIIVDNSLIIKNSSIGTCPLDYSNYCLARRCIKVGALRTFSAIFWGCENGKSFIDCIEQTQQDIEDKLNLTNIQCHCDYGEKGKDLTNVHYEVITAKPLQCKKGQFDSDGFGGTLVGECNDRDHFCFLASCAKGNEHVKQEWDCSRNRNCAAISERVGKAVNSSVSCKCLFGKADVDMANENFTREMMSTTTTAKPTTTTKKQTTTTTDKPTTTATAKPMDKSTAPSEGPSANTPEANCSARHNVAIFCNMFMALGVLASAHSMLIGHRFNAA